MWFIASFGCALSVSRREEFPEYSPTGVEGLDSMLEERGIPRGYTVLVLGSPGAGKTIMAIQFLHEGAVKHKEPGLYVLLDANRETLYRNMERLGFRLEALERRDLFEVLDISPVRYLTGKAAERVVTYNVGRRDFDITTFRRFLQGEMDRLQARRLVIDPLSIFLLRYPDEEERMFAMIDLIQSLTVTGTTNLLVHELKGTALEREHQFEEYIAQGLIVMRNSATKGELVRTIQVEKMRGVAHDSQPRPYKITPQGIEIYPKEKVL